MNLSILFSRLGTRKALFIISLAVLSVCGMALLIYGMRLGPGVGGDATIYINSAENLIQGNGLGLIGPRGEFRLIPYFPPFFSLVLAIFGSLALDLTQAAMWMNTLLFGGMIFLAGALTWHASKMALPALLVSVLIAVSPVLVPIYSWAMSEPLSIFLGYLGLGCILLHPEKDHNRKLLMAAAGLCGFSFLTRYGSIVFLITASVCILLLARSNLINRIRDAFWFGLVGSLPMIIWLVYDYFMTDTVASRRIESVQGLLDRFISFWQSFQDLFLFWLIPESWIYGSTPYPNWMNLWLMVIFWLVLGLMLYFVVRDLDKTRFAGLYRLVVMLAVFMLVYVLMMAVISLSTYPPITIANRMFSPVHIAVLWLLPVLMALFRQRWPDQQKAYLAFVVGLILFSGVYFWRTVRIVGQYRKSGLGYNSTAWKDSPTISAMKQISPTEIIITNETMAVLYLTGRASKPLMEIYWAQPGSDFSTYGLGDLTADESQRLFKQDGSPLVLFDTIYEQMSQLYGAKAYLRVEGLTEGLYQFFKGHDGAIYYYQKPGGTK
jgi:hypothetical protein